MRAYIKFISYLQNLLVGGSVLYLMAMPVLLAYYPDMLPESLIPNLFLTSLLAVTFVMAIRPLADILPSSVRFVRPLVILRKGFGVLSASIIVGFMLSKMLTYGVTDYLSAYTNASYWSLEGFALLAHVGDVSAIILLVTSNNLSKRLLGFWWKRIQKLAYVYFYAGATYEFLVFESTLAGTAMVVVTLLVLIAWAMNFWKRTHTEPSPSTPHTTQESDYTVRA
jgi:DMSO/TMAO reductase YedYZ heme-binding membrane subunit